VVDPVLVFWQAVGRNKMQPTRERKARTSV
jgi:hypothetical protein